MRPIPVRAFKSMWNQGERVREDANNDVKMIGDHKPLYEFSTSILAQLGPIPGMFGHPSSSGYQVLRRHLLQFFCCLCPP